MALILWWAVELNGKQETRSGLLRRNNGGRQMNGSPELPLVHKDEIQCNWRNRETLKEVSSRPHRTHLLRSPLHLQRRRRTRLPQYNGGSFFRAVLRVPPACPHPCRSRLPT